MLQHVSDNLDYAKTLVYVVHVGTHCTNVFISPWFHRRMHELLMWAAIAQMCSSALLVNTKTHCTHVIVCVVCECVCVCVCVCVCLCVCVPTSSSESEEL